MFVRSKVNDKKKIFLLTYFDYTVQRLILETVNLIQNFTLKSLLKFITALQCISY